MAELRFDITGDSSGAQRSARDLAGSMDVAARGARLLADSLDKQKRAAAASVGATLAAAKADRILADASDEAIAKFAEEKVALDRDRKAKEENALATAALARSTKGAAGGASALANPMGLLAGAGVALAPVILTVGTGLAGLGIAAAGIVSPILKAAKASGGLQANLSKLDPEQRTVAKSVLQLQQVYDGFQKSLAPVLLKDFNVAIAQAGPLLKEIQPVAQATGTALASVFKQVGATFRSGEWQQFFGFMARNAGPDIKLLGDLLTGLLRDLPPLVEALQPVAVAFLKIADAAAVAAQGMEAFGQASDNFSSHQSANVKIVEEHTSAIGTLGAGFLDLIGDYKGAQSWQQSFSTQVFKGGKLVNTAGDNAHTAAGKIQSLADAIKAVSDAESKALDTQLAYSNALITAGNDAKTLRDALKASSGQVGLQTATQRASFAAANTYIGDLENAAKQSFASGRGASAAARAISAGLPVLDSAKTKNRLYWQEVQILKNWLDKLRLEPAIREKILVTGTGSWSTKAALHAIGQGPGPFATGGRVPGTGSGDTFPALLTPGEAVVPKRLVPAVAPFLKANRVPGFAAGGLVPAYSGTVAGLQPWAAHNVTATNQTLLSAIAGSIAHAFAAAVRSAASGFADSGARSGSAAVAQQYAAGLLASFGWGRTQFGPLLALWNRESGWNAYAVNPSSGAYGIPQSLGHGHPYNLGDYKAQILWGLRYIASRYGSPAAAWSHELATGWYDRGGYLPPGLSLAYNGTGRPEPVGTGRGAGKVVLELRSAGSSDFDRFMTNWLQRSVRDAGGGDVQVAFGTAY